MSQHLQTAISAFLQAGPSAFLEERGETRRRQQELAQQLQQRLSLEDILAGRREKRDIAAEERRFGRELDLLGKRADLRLENALKLSEEEVRKEFGIFAPAAKFLGTRQARSLSDVLKQKFVDPSETLPTFNEIKARLKGQLSEGESTTVETRDAGRITLRGPKAEKVKTISPTTALTQFRLNEPTVRDSASSVVNKWRNQFNILKSQTQPVTPEKIEQIRTWANAVVPTISKFVLGTTSATQVKINARNAALQLIDEMEKYNSRILSGMPIEPTEEKPLIVQPTAGAEVSEKAFLDALERAGQLTD